ncbi:hypothetical protein [Klebsiella pneumoniae]|uniref:hypothetical protein n=1 Tax=Klebsiella pneumoniae TaxID=573 RepID=UPI001F4A95B7|nr:hypothetical protein [Klebsiella pneumoniae]HBW3346621.1 hypothetical protein [Klebsiella pneumoniae]
MEKMIEQFKTVAPKIAQAVATRVKGASGEEQVLAIIHDEIVHHFIAFQNMTVQYLTFNMDQRREFAELMYDLLASEGYTWKLKPKKNESQLPPATAQVTLAELPAKVQEIAAQCLANKMNILEGPDECGPAKSQARQVRDAFIELYLPRTNASSQHSNDQQAG